MRLIVSLFLAVVFVLGMIWLWPRLEGDPPVLSGPERIEVGSGGATIEVGWQDEGMGLARVSAALRLPSSEGAAPRETVLFENRFRRSEPGDPIAPVTSESRSLELDPATLELPDGDATLVLRATDASWAGFGDGNEAERAIPIRVDTRAPTIAITSGLTYVRRGGAALVRYRVDEASARSGVRVGDAYFPALARTGGERLALFAIPVEAADSPTIEVVAVDAFGNEEAIPFDARVRERSTATTPIALSDRFLDHVERTFSEQVETDANTPTDTFRWVNETLRERNEARIAEAIPEPTDVQWSGRFEQMRGSKVMSEFAELRHYTLGGRVVSHARHYGYDLASTARSPITASNTGTVVFAGDNGIYGNMVLIDHGLGLTSLYGHLSSVDVAVGDAVEKGQSIGRSGATGLAGGDHLHFALLVGNTYVDPLEWWDASWLRNRIESRLGRE